MIAYDHTATQHDFAERCLRFFYAEVDIEEDEHTALANDLPEFAATIIEVGGYDLDKRIASLTAERDALQAENTLLREALRPFAEIGKIEFSDYDRTIPVHFNYFVAARRALENQA